jgi:hypothetical protein
MSCEELEHLAPEVALGTIDGQERAEALRHLATCAECRRLVDELTTVADELLMVAPVQEPPVGFESRVIDAMGLQRRPRLGRRLLAWLAPPAAAAALTAVALVGVYHDDRVTAERYRTTLEQADGKSFQAQPLRDGAGARAGVAFGYQARPPRPSWMLVTVDPGHRDEVASAELVTRDRRTIPLPGFELGPDGSWGGAIPVDLYDVSAIRLLGDRPGQVLEAAMSPR